MSDAPPPAKREKDEYGNVIRTFADVGEFLRQAAVGEKVTGNTFWLSSNAYVTFPQRIRFFCHWHDCQREMVFELVNHSNEGVIKVGTTLIPLFQLEYKCRYSGSFKTFLIHVILNKDENWFVKAGEWPRSDPPLPRALLKLAGPSGGFLLKGYQAEMNGYGLAAIACYRRVVEDRKNEILAQIRNAVEHLEESSELQDALTKAVATRRFSTAMELVKDHLPRALFVDDKNPLSILFNTMSEAFHAWTDEQCLAHAAMMRVTLTLLIERMRSLVENDGQFRELLNKIEKAPSTLGSDAT